MKKASVLVWLSCVAVSLASTSALTQTTTSHPQIAGQRHSGFHGITIGQPISRLPFRCGTPQADCGGILDGNFVNVSVWNSRVTRIDVIYKGIFKGTGHLIEVQPPITLAQALKLHSLRSGNVLPAVRYGGDSFFVDLVNHITYMTDSTTPSLSSDGISKNVVNIVSYVSSDAPILKPAENKSLGPSEASLLADARSSTQYAPVKAPESLALSGYMRDVSLLYVENVEKAVDFATDSEMSTGNRDAFSEQQFKLLDALEDRIEIHTEKEADKDFFEHGLKRLRLLAQTYTVTTGLSSRLAAGGRETEGASDRQKAEERLTAAKNAIEPYIRCDSYIRRAIKEGEYHLDALREDDCKLTPDRIPSWQK
jgi:hypothetical protein